MIKNKKYTHFLPKISTLDARKNGSSALLVTMELFILIVEQKLYVNGKSLPPLA